MGYGTLTAGLYEPNQGSILIIGVQIGPWLLGCYQRGKTDRGGEFGNPSVSTSFPAKLQGPSAESVCRCRRSTASKRSLCRVYMCSESNCLSHGPCRQSDSTIKCNTAETLVIVQNSAGQHLDEDAVLALQACLPPFISCQSQHSLFVRQSARVCILQAYGSARACSSAQLHAAATSKSMIMRVRLRNPVL